MKIFHTETDSVMKMFQKDHVIMWTLSTDIHDFITPFYMFQCV
jgi:hypothetical protein